MSRKNTTSAQNAKADNAKPNSGNGLPAGNETSSSVREFLYLDTPRIHSYLSQLEGGLRLLAEKVEEAYSSTSETDPEKEERIRAGLAASIFGVIPALMGGGRGNFDYSIDRRTIDATQSTQVGDKAVRTDLSILHHKAFDLVYEAVGDSFLTVTGKLTLLDIRYVQDVYKQTTEAPNTMNAEEKANKEAETANALHGFKLMDAFGARLLMYLEEAKGPSVHAMASHEHLTLPFETIRHTYGSPTELDFTLVGISAQHMAKHRRDMPKQVSESPNAMGRAAFTALNEADTFLNQFFGTTSGQRLYPLALMLEL